MRVFVPKENENQLIVKNKGKVSSNLSKINNHQCNLKNTIKKSTLRRYQHFDPTENKNMRRTKCPFESSLPRPPLLGVGKMISSVF